jgi:hypothetical protein
MIVDIPHPLIPDLRLLGLPISSATLPAPYVCPTAQRATHRGGVAYLGYSPADITSLSHTAVI